MICNDCNSKIYLQAFSKGECIKCKKEITTHHTPSHVVCSECAEESICQQCGRSFAEISKETCEK